MRYRRGDGVSGCEVNWGWTSFESGARAGGWLWSCSGEMGFWGWINVES